MVNSEWLMANDSSDIFSKWAMSNKPVTNLWLVCVTIAEVS